MPLFFFFFFDRFLDRRQHQRKTYIGNHQRIQEEDWVERKVVHRDGRAVKFRVETGNIKR